MKPRNIPYGRQCLDQADIEEVVKVLKSDWLTQGPKIKEFETQLAKATGAKYAVAVSSGTAALHIACLAAGITKGDEVITSPITFVASSNAVLYCQAKPIFADIEADSINIDPEEIEKKISEKTKAIIPVHFAGLPPDLKEIRQIAKSRNLTVIEDAAHALGGEYQGSKIGSGEYSDMTTFSFHPLKQITTGEGGAVVTNREDLYQKLLILRSHGITKDKKALSQCPGPWYYEQKTLGFNYRITDFQSALGVSQLKKLDKFLKRREEIADIYNQQFAGFKEIELPKVKSDRRSAWHLYWLKLKNSQQRSEVFKALHQAGIRAQVHYIPVHLQPYYRDNFGYKAGDYPKAEDYYSRAITIPLYPKMSKEEIVYAIKTIKNLLR